MKTFSKNLRITILIFLTFVVFDSLGLSKTGMLWDELAVASYGESYIGYFKNLNFNQRDWSLNNEHPPLGKYIYGVARTVTKKLPFLYNMDPLYPPSRSLTFARFFSVLMGGITVAGVFLLSSRYFGTKVGLLSSVFLATNPHFLAYTRVASLEMPLTMFGLLFIWAFLSAVDKRDGAGQSQGSFIKTGDKTGLPRFGVTPNTNWLLIGILLGTCLASRFNGVFMFFLYEAGLLLFYGKSLFTKKHIWKVFIPAIAFLFLYLIWPWLWRNPFYNFSQSVDRGFEVHTKEIFLGQKGLSPFYYYFIYFLATTPVVQLVGLLFVSVCSCICSCDACVANWFSRIWRKLAPMGQLQEKRNLLLFLFLYLLTPFLASFVPLKQDGIRYVQFSLPALAILAAVGWSWVVNCFSCSCATLWRQFNSNKFNWQHKVLQLQDMLFIVLALLSLSIPLRFYPYYLDYYNGLFGSLDKIVQNKTFEFGWWGEGSLEAVGFLNQRLDSEDTVFVDFAPGHTVPSFIEGVKSIKLWEGEPNYIIINLYANWYGDADKTYEYVQENNYKLIYEVQVAHQVPIVWVYAK